MDDTFKLHAAFSKTPLHNPLTPIASQTDLEPNTSHQKWDMNTIVQHTSRNMIEVHPNNPSEPPAPSEGATIVNLNHHGAVDDDKEEEGNASNAVPDFYHPGKQKTFSPDLLHICPNTISEMWKIVDRPTLPSGEPCEGNFTYSTGFRMVEWPHETNRDQKFTHFSKLPGEIQNRIWVLSLPEPQVVIVYCDQWSPLDQRIYARTTNNRAILGNHLLVCRDSRSIFLHYYRPLQTLEQVAETEHAKYHKKDTRMIYVDGSWDTVLINAALDCIYCLKRVAYQMDISRIQHLAICQTHFDAQNENYWKALEEYCPRLKTLSCVVHLFFDDIAICDWRTSDMSNFKFQLIPIDNSLKRRGYRLEYNDKFTSTIPYPQRERQTYEEWIDMLFSEAKTQRVALFKGFDEDANRHSEKSKSIKVNFAFLMQEELVKWWDAEILYLVPNSIPHQEAATACYTVRPLSPYQQNMTRQFPKKCSLYKHMRLCFPSPESIDQGLYDGVSELFEEKNVEGDEMYDGVSRLFESVLHKNDPLQEELERNNIPGAALDTSGHRVLTAWYDSAEYQAYGKKHDWRLSRQLIQTSTTFNNLGCGGYYNTLVCERRESADGIYFVQAGEKYESF